MIIKLPQDPKRPNDFIKNGNHLPPFMRDFHDQKRLFKMISDYYSFRDIKDANGPGSYIQTPNWCEAMCYVLDRFLQFMALHGYTLQKSRSNVSFCDMEKSIADFMKKEEESLKLMFETFRQEKASELGEDKTSSDSIDVKIEAYEQ